MILRELLRLAAERYGEREVIVDGEVRWTYGDWETRVRALAGVLWKLGVRKGDRVVQVMRNREENCALHFACQYVGAVNVPLNFRWSSGEIAYCLGDAEPKVVVFEDGTRERVLEAVRRAGGAMRLVSVDGEEEGEVVSLTKAVEEAGAEVPGVTVGDGDVAVMLYTSGTTGRPKGVPRSQRAEYAATVGQIIQHRLERGERALGVMPLYHTMGLHTLTSMVALNGTFVVMREWDVGAALQLIQEEGVTYLYLVPTLYHEMTRDERLKEYDVRSVQKLAWAGAPMLSSLVARCAERFRPKVFVNHYGSTEVYTHTVYDDPVAKPGCAGRAGLHTEVRVVRAAPGAEVSPEEVVAQGEMGEIIVRLGDEAFAGYYNRPEATARAIRGGWYFTGDTGYIDSDGDLWVTGRVDDMIITGGENVYPVEVEEVIARHPRVRDVAVVGLPDERWGQIVAAFVVPADPGLTEEELDAFCLESGELARFKRPRRYVFVSEIPRSGTGKVLRRLLVEGQRAG